MKTTPSKEAGSKPNSSSIPSDNQFCTPSLANLSAFFAPSILVQKSKTSNPLFFAAKQHCASPRQK
jgi:hypothetical protein